MERFTKSKNMVFPRGIIIGHNTTTQIADLCNRIGLGDSVLIVADKITKKLSGEEIKKIVTKANYKVDIKLISAPTLANSMATDRPLPLVAPLIITVLFFNDIPGINLFK